MGYWEDRNRPYQPGQAAAFKVSRSKIELFMQCPRCFWLDVRLKIKRPNSPPFRINSAIDELFKKEFDVHRKAGTPHPLMLENKVDAVPYVHDDLDKWRHTFTGIQYLHEKTNLLLFGAVDDLWVTPDGQLLVVDYKATAKDSDVSIDADWQMSYKRQMEIYQWLLRQNGFDVADMGYFVYTNGRLDMEGFFDKVEFRTKVIPYAGDAGWVEPAILKIKKVMDGDMPAVGKAAMGGDCDYCAYAKARTELTLAAVKSGKKSATKQV